MIDAYASRAAAQRGMEDADQTEQSAIVTGTAIFDAGIYDQRLAGAMDDFEPTNPEASTAWQVTDLAVDEAVGGVHTEIVRRAKSMGPAYPFEISGNTIRYTPRRTTFYEFCLAISLSPSLTSGAYSSLPRVFERCATALIREYLGTHTSALHVGEPRDSNVGKTFRSAMDKLHKESKEWIWGPEAGLPDDPKHAGDEGIDFVVWKEMLDKRSGQLFVVGQCACGDNWHTKLHDVDLRKLGKWFRPLSYITPVRAFSSPRHIAPAWLPEACRIAGLVFDRARLSITAELSPDSVLSPWEDQFKKLTAMVLKANAIKLTAQLKTQPRAASNRRK